MKKCTRLLFVGFGFLVLFTLTGCQGGSYYGVNSYHTSAWGYNHYDRDDYYDDRRDHYVDRRNDVARARYVHQRTGVHRSARAGRRR